MISDNTAGKDTKIPAGDSDQQAGVAQCDVCRAKVSLSVAKSAEALDYVHYFCGLNCLQTWLSQTNATVAGKPHD